MFWQLSEKSVAQRFCEAFVGRDLVAPSEMGAASLRPYNSFQSFRTAFRTSGRIQIDAAAHRPASNLGRP